MAGYRVIVYSQTEKKSSGKKLISPSERKSFQQGADIMKEKTIAALTVLRDIASENLGFVLVWAAALAVILKLACV